MTVRGNVGDARPFARSLNSSPAPASSRGAQASKPRDAKEARDVDLDLVLNILTGYNDEAITNAVVKASIRKDAIRQLDVKGRLGSSNLTAQTVTRGGVPLILLEVADAGGMLRFLDIYRRMAGGDLVMQLAAGEGPQTGFLTLRDFVLKNEPALRRIIPTQSQVVTGQDSAGNRQNVRIDVNEVAFTQARVDFVRTAGRLDFKDAAIWGQAIGFTLSGFMDYGRDQLDIAGTFVPAFGLNNAFAQVPLFGPLLGGSRNEGLFAVNFRIFGQATAPSLSVNPLSAVAPGFLRKLFGAGGEQPTGPFKCRMRRRNARTRTIEAARHGARGGMAHRGDRPARERARDERRGGRSPASVRRLRRREGMPLLRRRPALSHPAEERRRERPRDSDRVSAQGRADRQAGRRARQR